MRLFALGITVFALMGFYCGFDDKQIYAWGYDDGKCMGLVDAEITLTDYTNGPTAGWQAIKYLEDKVCQHGSVDLGAKNRGGQ